MIVLEVRFRAATWTLFRVAVNSMGEMESC